MRIIVGYLLGKFKKEKSDVRELKSSDAEETKMEGVTNQEIGSENSIVLHVANSSVVEIKVSDIDPVGRHPEDILSNLCKNAFCIDEIYCECMDNFLQSLKYKDGKTQIDICSQKNHDIGKHDSSDWQKEQILWWKGRPINRHSPEYHDFIYNAYLEMFLWSARFRDVLMSTGGKKFLYNSGNTNPYTTILTDEEFCKVLTDLRERNMEDYKKYRYPRRWPNCYGVEEDYV